MNAISKVAFMCWFLLMGMGAMPLAAQQSPQQPTETASGQGKEWGDYHVQQSMEFGYRVNLIDGNINNYDTFVNLGSGWRLLSYTLNMRSLNHNGLLFDNLTFNNFGYGGDPNNISRLRIEKNKYYDLRILFRRDKFFWDYNLLANPLNPISSTPALPVVTSPHALDLVRRMQDYDLTLFPQARVRFRLGYSRNVNEGPGFTTVHTGTEALLTEAFHYTTNSYRAGVDIRVLPKTTLSFDELLSYFKQDNTVLDRNFGFVLVNGTPVDLGIVFDTVNNTPCATPLINAATLPPTANANCNGYLSYTRVGRPRGSFPTERFSFQSSDVHHLAMAGSVSYSNSENSIPDFSEVMTGWTTRTISRGSTTTGPAKAQRVFVTADWSADYRLTDRLHVLDAFQYMNWRIPAAWTTLQLNLFGAAPAAPGQSGMLLPVAPVNEANFATVCPPPYNGPQCPRHNASSPADIVRQLVSRFLGQEIKANRIELAYTITPRVEGRLGYSYTGRRIADYNATFDLGTVYFPGGATATPANDFLAARGDCALVAGTLPPECVLRSDGSIVRGSLTDPAPTEGSDTARNVLDIHEHALLVGLSARPWDSLRIVGDFLFGYNDRSFTRISPRQVQSYKIHATYTPRSWARIEGAIDLHENRDNVLMVNNREHDRAYSIGATFGSSPALWVDVGYSYLDVSTQTEICFAEPGSTVFTTPCPIPGATGPLGARSFYNSTDHYAHADLLWKPISRVILTLGYAGAVVRGDTLFLNPLQPTGPLEYNYFTPSASLEIVLHQYVSYKTTWNYYGYNDQGIAHPAGLTALPRQDFNGSTAMFSLRFTF